MLTVLCFKWFDPDGRHNDLFVYGPEYVNKVRWMVRRHLAMPHELVCCTDDPEGLDHDIRVVPLPDEARQGGLSPKLYAFHPDAAAIFGPRILMLDLDVVICQSLDPLVDRDEPLVCWSGPPYGNLCGFNTTFVLMDGGAFPEVWTDYDPETSPEEMRAAGLTDCHDQDWVWLKAGARGVTVPRSGAGIESFTPNRFSHMPSYARLISFNGRAAPGMPRCQHDAPWIREHWR